MINYLLSFFRKPVNFLELLPCIISQHIGAYLQPEDILNLMLVNKNLYNIYLNPYFLISEQAFLDRVRCYNKKAALLNAERESIDQQIIKCNQIRFDFFKKTIKSGFDILKNDIDASSIYNDCFQLANEISNEHTDPLLYYQSDRTYQKIIFTTLLSLSFLFFFYCIGQMYRCDSAIRDAERFWRLEARTNDCCLRSGLEDIPEDCQEIYMGYHDQNTTEACLRGGMPFYFILFMINFAFMFVLSLAALEVHINKVKIYMFQPIQKLKWKHDRNLQKIARTFPVLLQVSSIENLVNKLMEIYEEQPSFYKNNNKLFSKGHGLFGRLTKLDENKKTAFNYSDNKQLTLFGKRCDQFVTECQLSLKKVSSLDN